MAYPYISDGVLVRNRWYMKEGDEERLIMKGLFTKGWAGFNWEEILKQPRTSNSGKS